jgi:hypothetical protein
MRVPRRNIRTVLLTSADANARRSLELMAMAEAVSHPAAETDRFHSADGATKVHALTLLALLGFFRVVKCAPWAQDLRRSCYTPSMLIGAHILLYSDDPEADRAFFRDILGFPSVDAGEGWLIFKLPPAEVALHPTGEDKHVLVHGGHRLLGSSLYLMCDDLRAQIRLLQAKKVQCTEIEEAPWGIKTTIKLPSGGEIGLYQPKHPTAFGLN